MSDDGQHGLTVIAMLGNVFSPYYAWRRRRAAPNLDPFDHCALNVVLYGRDGKKRWAMTERGRGALHQSADTLRIGPSGLHWDGEALTIDVDELTVPLPSRLRGRIRVHPSAINPQDFVLDGKARHRWWPIAPVARVELDFQNPGLRWSGAGYLDSNRGEEPLEAGFQRWDWSRAALSDGAATLYDATERDGRNSQLALRFARNGEVEQVAPPPRAALPTASVWRVGRGTQCEAGDQARVVQTLEDTPFYVRSVVETRLCGERVESVHESLDLDRFAANWVQMLLPFRMPRKTWD
ncbi:MAG: carotenoid 1,2-hydratase [Marichromatium sp.]|nr:carotenoid 1,2-hydratase [Marichromatium sp.]